MLGPRWTTEELSHFYIAYRKYNKDWKKIASAVSNLSPEMVEALYTMNRAYLSLPHGTASSDGLIAMMTDHYCNLAGSESDLESNDGTASSRKTQKRANGKVQPTTSKVSNDQFVSHSPVTVPDYGFQSLLKKKRTGGSRPCPVGKRTPRFLISFPNDKFNAESNVSIRRPGLKLKANANDDEVAQEIAIALAEASQKVGSSKVSRTPSKIVESVMSSPFRCVQRKHSLVEMTSNQNAAFDKEELEGSTEADTGSVKEKTRKLKGKNYKIGNNSEHLLGDIKEECSGTEEGQEFGAMRDNFYEGVTDTKISRSSVQCQRKKSKKVLFERDDAPAFDALQTLAGLSLMMPTGDEDDILVSHLLDSRLQFKDEASKNLKTEAHPDIHLSRSPQVEDGGPGKKLMNRSKKSSQSGSPHLLRNSENSSSANTQKEASEPAQLAQLPVVNQINLLTKVGSSRKMGLKKPQKCLDNISNKRSDLSIASINGRAHNSKKNVHLLVKSLSEKMFVEYLYHVWLGHVPRLTRVEWGAIRSSLGKPRRFSEQFLKEEKEKLNQYRDSVRKHYTELREGRGGLPTDLVRRLSVGQRVTAIHPKTREVHDGSVLTADHSRCRVQFDRHELGFEFIMDIDCMLLNPLENLPTALAGKQPISADKFFVNFNELKVCGRIQEYMKLCPVDNVSCKGSDVQALADLTRALEKKEAVVLELRRMNDVLLQLNEANEQFLLLYIAWELRQRNTYQRSMPLLWLGQGTNSADRSACHTNESGPHVNEIIDSSRTKAHAMVDAAMQAIASLKYKEGTTEKIEEAIDYVNGRLPSDDSSVPMDSNFKASDTEYQIPFDLISKCVATLLMIQKCTQRQFPPSDVAQILRDRLAATHLAESSCLH
ncbi:protein ALWAYS EARLY 3-like [Salvia divinorum]|uniref:Protein ALWAYS EARLY 3-like n=1 Tax=Salvia divinorum TaxID=28513 RepID=A0ABD1FZ99_SALDI